MMNNDLKPPARRLFSPLLLFILFLSGMSGLIYEIAWSRKLGLILGNSTYAITIVITSFMAGLGLGSYFIGKYTDKLKHPLKAFIGLEIFTGLYGLLSPAILAVLSWFVVLIFSILPVSGILPRVMRLILSFTALLIPTFAMGGTLPVMVKAFKGRGNTGSRAGMLYSVNTLGGIAGCILAGFFLIRHFGVNASIYLAAAINLAAALLIIPFRDYPSVETGADTAPAGKNIKMLRLVLLVTGISGFTGMAYEVLWTRVLVLFFKDSVYDFTIVLAAFLTGLMLGSFIFSLFFRNSKKPVYIFGLLEVLIGLASIAFLLLINRLPYMINFLHSIPRAYERFGDGYWFWLTALKFFYAFLLMLIPTTLLGGVFPLATAICGRPESAGKDVGRVYAINTAGSVLGSIIAGFILIAALGTRNSIIAIGLVNITAGMLILFKNNSRNKYLVLTVTTITVILLIAFIPRWDKIRMSAGFFDPNSRVEDEIEVVYYNEDATGITSVLNIESLGQKYLKTNRVYMQCSSAMGGSEDHRRLGHIPVLLHTKPSNALVVGLGTGITLRGVAEHDLSIDCIEISGAVMEAAHYFNSENNSVMDNPSINFINEDGRNYLQLSGKKYDLIITDIIFPMCSGAGSMFSKEWFELCRESVNENGLVCQWIPLNQVSPELLKSIIRTFSEVFPGTSLWWGMTGEYIPVLGCVGSKEKFEIDVTLLENKLKSNTRLEQINLAGIYQFLGNFIMAGTTIEEFTSNAALMTDNKPDIEFISPTIYTEFKKQGIMNQVELVKNTGNILQYLSATGRQGLRKPESEKIIMHLESKKAVIKGLDTYIKHGLEKALPPLRTALDNNPANRELRVIYYEMELRFLNFCEESGDYYFRNYLDEAALAYYSKIIDTNPRSNHAKKAFSMIAKIHKENKRFKEELKTREEALQYFPD